MGMSGDFELAIEEGATMVRFGTVLFGQRRTIQMINKNMPIYLCSFTDLWNKNI